MALALYVMAEIRIYSGAKNQNMVQNTVWTALTTPRIAANRQVTEPHYHSTCITCQQIASS